MREGRAGARCRPLTLTVAALAVLALVGCESSQEKNAKLVKAAKALEAKTLARGEAAEKANRITHPSRKVAVSGVTLLHGAEGLAAVVTLQNRTGAALHEIPVQVTVTGSGGRTLYTNATQGQAKALVSAVFLPAHGRLTWVDDQIPPQPGASGATAIVGEAPATGSAVPKLAVQGAHVTEDPASGTGAEGQLVNHSAVNQSELVVYAVARKGGKVVAAGRAVLPEAEAGSSTPFQLFFIGDPKGAEIEYAAPPPTLH